MPNLGVAVQHFPSPVPPSIAWYAFSLRKGLGSHRSAKKYVVLCMSLSSRIFTSCRHCRRPQPRIAKAGWWRRHGAAACWEGRKDGNGRKKGVREQAAARALCREYIIFAKLAGNPRRRGCSSLSEAVRLRTEALFDENRQTNSAVASNI